MTPLTAMILDHEIDVLTKQREYALTKYELALCLEHSDVELMMRCYVEGLTRALEELKQLLHA